MLRRLSRVRDDERGVALITALLATAVMLALGLALLSIVDTQASESTSENTRDRAFNLSESVLNSEAFVLSRTWPASGSVLSGTLECQQDAAGFGAEIGELAPTTEGERLRPALNAAYTDAAYDGAKWQVNICDDVDGSLVWDDTLLVKNNWDANANKKLWVRAQSTVNGKTRALTGLVRVRTTEALDSKYGLASGGLTDDLGTAVNSLSTSALNGTLAGLLGVSPTVAADPTQTATTPPSSGVTGLRCGALDMKLVPASTCLSGTIGALGALPIINTFLTGGQLEQFPTTTAATEASISQLRAQAVSTNTYYKSTPGSSSVTLAGTPACTFTSNTGTRSADTVVFIEKVGSGDQYCAIDVSSGVRWKALVIGSGRVIIRGSGTTTGTPTFTANPEVPQTNTFSGVVYALNLQRHSVDDGGLNLGDDAAPGRVVVRIDNSAHVKGAVNADGKSAKVQIIPPPLTINTNALVDSLIPCTNLVTCLLNGTVKALGGVTSIVDDLINRLGVSSVTAALLGQLQPQRAQYGSAIVSDVAAVKRLTVYGTSGVVTGTFQDMQAR